MSSNYSLVKSAILSKKQIHATYKGYFREMCPHVIGLKKGKEHALFYQCGGKSKSGLSQVGSPDNWRCLPINELKGVSIVDGEWFTAPNHSRPQTCVDDIDVEVKF